MVAVALPDAAEHCVCAAWGGEVLAWDRSSGERDDLPSCDGEGLSDA